MNAVGPYHNRQETYAYFSLPFCKGPVKDISHYHETIGEALQGVELEYSGLEIGFKGAYYVCIYLSMYLMNVCTYQFTLSRLWTAWYLCILLQGVPQ